MTVLTRTSNLWVSGHVCAVIHECRTSTYILPIRRRKQVVPLLADVQNSIYAYTANRRQLQQPRGQAQT